MNQTLTNYAAVYEAPAAETIVLETNSCLCASDRGNGLDTLDGEEW